MPSVLLVALSALVLLLGVVPAPARAAACTDPDPIARHYCELGGSASILGTPVGAPYVVGTGRAQNYSNGTIYWTAAAGAYEAHGLVGAHYRALGGPTGILGFPVTDELGTADGVGRYNHFQRGSIFFTPATGAHEVHGAIGSEWAALGYERSVLGYPVTDELGTGDGVGRYSGFERGAIYFTPATGAHEVHGAIMGTWASLGFAGSVVGYPITDEYSVNGGRQSDFQGGFLRWTEATGVVRVAVIPPYQRVGTWVTRYRFSREYAGPNPPISPAQVDTMAAAGVHTIYIQAAADDPLYPGLLSPDLLGQFLTRAHAHGMQVVAWYLPHFADVAADLRRMQAMADFRASGQAFDALGVDIEDRTIADPAARNAALVDFSTRLAAALPAVTLGAIVLPPVVTDVINPVYWPNFPWRQLSGLYQVWLPMAYWSNRTDPVYSDPYRYTSENVSRLRADLGEQCAAVSVIGGYGTAETPADYAAGARAAADQGSIGFSIFDWTTTPASVWPAVRGYSLRGC